MLPLRTLSFAQASREDLTKYSDPRIQTSQLMEWRARVIVSSLNVLPNHDLLAITPAEQEDAPG